jgi:tRNA pseudouridine55 synthase
LDVEIACGGGTYIRAIARDLGAALNVGGTLAALTRTQSSGFDLAGSLSLED